LYKNLEDSKVKCYCIGDAITEDAMADLRQCYISALTKRACAAIERRLKYAAEQNYWETKPGMRPANLSGLALARQTEQLRTLRRENQGLGLSAKGNKPVVTTDDLHPTVRATKVMRATRLNKDAGVLGGMAGGSLAGGAIGGTIGGLSPLVGAAIYKILNPGAPMPTGLGSMMAGGFAGGVTSGAGMGATIGGIAGGVNDQERRSRNSNTLRGAGKGALVGGLTGAGLSALMPALSLALLKAKGQSLPSNWKSQLATHAGLGLGAGALGGAALGGVLGAARNPQ
jgi:hypothetical protein